MKLGKKITMRENTLERYADLCSVACNLCGCNSCSTPVLQFAPNTVHGTIYGYYNTVWITKY